MVINGTVDPPLDQHAEHVAELGVLSLTQAGLLARVLDIVEWNILDNGQPKLAMWTGEADALDRAADATGPLVRRWRRILRNEDHVAEWEVVEHQPMRRPLLNGRQRHAVPIGVSGTVTGLNDVSTSSLNYIGHAPITTSVGPPAAGSCP